MSEPKSGMTTITFKVDKDIKARAMAKARSYGLSLSEILRTYLEYFAKNGAAPCLVDIQKDANGKNHVVITKQ
jgi:antitoxin component of RelBE/YafQ-DinJ toxin-antitoxin module